MKNYDEVVEYLINIPKFSTKNEANHTMSLLRDLGNPQEAFSIIHVAGTNGKGSVSCFTASMLQEILGCVEKKNEMLKTCPKTESFVEKVGLFTSPHLVRINERFRINGEEVPDKAFVEAFETVMEAVEKSGRAHPTFFEMMLAIGLVIFKNAGVKIAVIETGLGGRLDATNVLTPVVSVITSIGLDHTEYLGETLEEVAGEKAGIIKTGIPVVYLEGEATTNAVICQKAETLKAPCFMVSKNDVKKIKKENKNIAFSIDYSYDKNVWVSLQTEGLYQADNAKVAIEIMKVLEQESDKIPVLKDKSFSIEKIQAGLAKAKWPGRMEEVLQEVYLDGAHNEAGITAFLQTLKGMEKSGKRVLLFAALADKDFEEMIEKLCKEGNFDRILVTQVESPRAAKADSMKAVFEKYTGAPVSVIQDNREAFLHGREEKGEEGALFCVGSLYFIGALKQIVSEGGMTND